MRYLLTHKRDYYAGGLMTLMGIGTIFESRRYNLGSLTHMGPGFFPTILGVVLTLVGLLIMLSAIGPPDGTDQSILPVHREWRGWLCILASPVVFIVLGTYGGLIPATFGCVLVAALGDRTATLKASLVLAAGVTVFGTILFSTVLHVSLPALRGVWW